MLIFNYTSPNMYFNFYMLKFILQQHYYMYTKSNNMYRYMVHFYTYTYKKINSIILPMKLSKIVKQHLFDVKHNF